MRQQDLYILDPAILPDLESRSGCLLGSLGPTSSQPTLEGPILHCYAMNPARPCSKARLRTSCTSMPRRRTPSVPSRGAACCSRTCVISRSCGREGEEGGASSCPMGAAAPACHKQPTAVQHLSLLSQRQSAECRQGCQPADSLQCVHAASRRRYQQPGTNAVVQHRRQSTAGLPKTKSCSE